jgi:hypothetical protein
MELGKHSFYQSVVDVSVGLSFLNLLQMLAGHSLQFLELAYESFGQRGFARVAPCLS